MVSPESVAKNKFVQLPCSITVDAGACDDTDPELVLVKDINNVPPEFRSASAKVQFQNDQGDHESHRQDSYPVDK